MYHTRICGSTGTVRQEAFVKTNNLVSAFLNRTCALFSSCSCSHSSRQCDACRHYRNSPKRRPENGTKPTQFNLWENGGQRQRRTHTCCLWILSLLSAISGIHLIQLQHLYDSCPNNDIIIKLPMKWKMSSGLVSPIKRNITNLPHSHTPMPHSLL